MTASYAKLKSGEWGIRVEGAIKSGQTITVKKKSGEMKTETVGKVVWSGNGITLATVAGSSGGSSYTPRASSTRERGYCNECGERIRSKTQHCWEMGGYCQE